jgi:hypothetical protein
MASTWPAHRWIRFASGRASFCGSRRGRASFQISGQTAFRCCIFGAFAAFLAGSVKLLFDSVRHDSASRFPAIVTQFRQDEQLAAAFPAVSLWRKIAIPAAPA